ncbi:MAG: hypothetical protein HC940_12295 [Acaryochloris sp. SU_5_25]|nr:hypothetical protein [Acaryochloris sp. SU_5_25]
MDNNLLVESLSAHFILIPESSLQTAECGFQQVEGEPVRDDRPGVEGHSGITGLDKTASPGELTNAQAKLLRKDLRSQLAELACKDHFLLDL